MARIEKREHPGNRASIVGELRGVEVHVDVAGAHETLSLVSRAVERLGGVDSNTRTSRELHRSDRVLQGADRIVQEARKGVGEGVDTSSEVGLDVWMDRGKWGRGRIFWGRCWVGSWFDLLHLSDLLFDLVCHFDFRPGERVQHSRDGPGVV